MNGSLTLGLDVRLAWLHPLSCICFPYAPRPSYVLHKINQPTFLHISFIQPYILPFHIFVRFLFGQMFPPLRRFLCPNILFQQLWLSLFLASFYIINYCCHIHPTGNINDQSCVRCM